MTRLRQGYGVAGECRMNAESGIYYGLERLSRLRTGYGVASCPTVLDCFTLEAVGWGDAGIIELR